MTPGVHSMPAEQYRKAEGVSKSMLDWLCPPRTPAHFCAKFIAGEIEDEETDALRFGSLTHRVILEPDTLKDAFYMRPAGLDGRTKEGKAWIAEHQDRLIITAAEGNALHRMRDAVWSHPMARRLLTGAETERSLFAFDAAGTLRKARLDALIKGNITPDLKTCRSAAADEFERAILDHGYHRQAAYYNELCKLVGIEKSRFAFICVEKTAPYCVAVYDLDPAVIEAGRLENERNLALYRQCLESNKWPGYSDTIEAIGLPKWAMKEIEQFAA